MIRLKYISAVLIVSVFLAGCAGHATGYEYTEETGDATADTVEGGIKTASGQYILLGVDEEAKEVRLYNTANSLPETYEYTSSTYVIDTYGDIRTWEYLSVGDAVAVAFKEGEAVLSVVQKSPDAWISKDIEDFDITYAEETIKYMTINSANYRIAEDVLVFSGDGQISLDELSSMDVITVTGYDRVINSIVVSSSHGILTLKGTEDYVGGWICIGSVYSGVITKDMSVEVRSGSYMLSAANSGKGGSVRITIPAGEETVFNLSDLGADSDKIGEIRFHIYPEDTVFTINGKEYDYSKAVKLRYGAYKLMLYSEEYGTVERILIVSSEKASIVFDMEELTGADTDEDTTVSTEEDSEDESEDTDDTDEENAEEETEDDSSEE